MTVDADAVSKIPETLPPADVMEGVVFSALLIYCITYGIDPV